MNQLHSECESVHEVAFVFSGQILSESRIVQSSTIVQVLVGKPSLPGKLQKCVISTWIPDVIVVAFVKGT